MTDLKKKFDALAEQELAMGGDASIERQRSRGKLTARERLDLLFDKSSFLERKLFMRHRVGHFGLDSKHFPAEAVVTGHGTVTGRSLCAASQDFTVSGGSVGEATGEKIASIMEQALKTGVPFVFINDSAGARIQEGVSALAAYGKIFSTNVAMSGVVPQISLIAGPCAGGAAYSPALTDFVIQVRGKGQMYITGPGVIKQVTGETVSAEDLGGSDIHASLSGVAHFVVEDDHEAIDLVKRLLSFLPSNNAEPAPTLAFDEALSPVLALDAILPSDPRRAYDMRQVIASIVDGGDFLEVHAQFAQNIVVGFARLTGRSVGIVGNQPQYMAGVLDSNASDKAARFVRFCDAFNIALISLVDVPGFMPGVQQESFGIIRHGAKLLYAYAEATVPKLTVVLRKAYGGAYIAMCSKSLGADAVAAWPTAEIAVMGAEGAIGILYAKELASADDKVSFYDEKTREYRDKFASPLESAQLGLLDAIISPSETRIYLAKSLANLYSKRAVSPARKHGNIPL